MTVSSETHSAYLLPTIQNWHDLTTSRVGTRTAEPSPNVPHQYHVVHSILLLCSNHKIRQRLHQNVQMLCLVLSLTPSNCKKKMQTSFSIVYIFLMPGWLSQKPCLPCYIVNLLLPVCRGTHCIDERELLHSKICTMGDRKIRENLTGSTHLPRSKDNNSWQAQGHVWAWWQGVCGQRNKV